MDLLPTSDVRAQVGRGVTATVANWAVTVGSPDSAAASSDLAITAMVEGEEAQGHTAVVVSWNLALADQIRPESAAAVAALHQTSGREPVLLTGDNARAATSLAAQVGLADVRAGLLPHDKVTAVQNFQADGQRGLLVGDGVNDAPALAAADIGVAMGGIGSDVALSSADRVIVRDNLGTLSAVIRLSGRARRLVIQNLVFAATVITVLVAWDLIGHLPLPLGVAGHEGSTILVALNGLRLLRRAEWKPSSPR
jgi:P-type E1-E2 ATPase